MYLWTYECCIQTDLKEMQPCPLNKMYICACVCICSGYVGENCQVDIDECEQHPCENGGECFQRSDILNYGTLPELSKANFSYEAAAGFICHCQPGFAGKPQQKALQFVSIVSHSLIMKQ